MRTEVLAALIEADIKKEDVEGIEAPRKNKCFVVFNRYADKRHNMGEKIKIRDNLFTLEHPDPRPYQTRKTKVKIFYYPLDEETSGLETVQRHYGTFTEGSMRDLEDRNCGIKNGIKEMYMHVNRHIPSYLHVGKNMIRVEYAGQTATCRKCHKTGHIARECSTEVTCRKCGADDHTPAECPNIICFHCGKKGHTSSNCFEYEEQYPDLNQNNENETVTDSPFQPHGSWNEPDHHIEKPKDNKQMEENPTETETATTENNKEEEGKTTQPKDIPTEEQGNEETTNKQPDTHVEGNEETQQDEERETEGKRKTEQIENNDEKNTIGKTNEENNDKEEEPKTAKETETIAETENTTENITDQEETGSETTTQNENIECESETIKVVHTEITDDETESETETEGDEDETTPQSGKRKRNKQKSKPLHLS